MDILELTEYKYDLSELVWEKMFWDKNDESFINQFLRFYVDSVIVSNGEHEWYMDITISGKRRYINFTNLYDENDEIKFEFNNRLFAPSINKYRGTISIDGLTIVIDDAWDFNCFLLIVKHADDLFKKGMYEEVEPIHCNRYVPDHQYNMSFFVKEYFPDEYTKHLYLNEVSFIYYDDYNDSFIKGKGELNLYILNCRTDNKTTLLDLLSNPNECLIIGEIFNAEIYYSNIRADTNQYKCIFLIDSELEPFLGGDINQNTIYYFKDENRINGYEIKCNSIEDFNLLGYWLYTAFYINTKNEMHNDKAFIEPANENIFGIEENQDSFEDLDKLIGLASLKQDVEELISFVKVQKIRNEKGMKSVPVSLHLVFTGNPGTGKTTVARILGNLYKDIGILSKGQLVEVDRSALVAGYVGQTAIKTQEKIKEALGGILFIDEAYTLVKDSNDFGQEAIDTILKAMEDYRDQFIVIVAGYDELMNRFINSNPGLKSRFNKYIKFNDYDASELYSIFNMMCDDYGYLMESEVKTYIRNYLELLVQNKNTDFANARDVRNLFESIITNQATRIVKIKDINDEDMMMITTDDVKLNII